MKFRKSVPFRSAHSLQTYSPVKSAMHDLANGLSDTEVSTVISWLQPGTNGGGSMDFSAIWDCLLGHDCGRYLKAGWRQHVETIIGSL